MVTLDVNSDQQYCYKADQGAGKNATWKPTILLNCYNEKLRLPPT
jgi:hypothetical protein